jgi:sphingomyelin phosphodiesterase
MNTLYCDTINLYLIQDQTMPIRQLKTLHNIIKSKENVVLIGHISPTSPSCSDVYSKLFRAVLTSQASKIKGQFYGHTHLDQYVVNTDPRDNETATSFGFLAGSFSPLGTNLPRMRVYEFSNDFDLINYKDYAFNLQTIKWGTNYNFKEYYGLPLDQVINGESMKKFQH